MRKFLVVTGMYIDKATAEGCSGPPLSSANIKIDCAMRYAHKWQ